MPTRPDDERNLPPSEDAFAFLDDTGPDLRRPPLDQPFTMQVRVDLEDSDPPIWRRIDLASDLTLDVVHRVVQVVMGWTHSHLHAFSVGGPMHSPGSQRFLTRYDIEEGDLGVAEAEVRLDQVLQTPGDELFYEYDFGDGWTHRIVLEAIDDRPDDAPPARCTQGELACPPEDVGGVYGYKEFLDAHAGRLPDPVRAAELLRWAGPELDPDRFSLDEVNARLPFAMPGGALPAFVPSFLRDMLDAVGEDARPLLEELVATAHLDDDTHVSADVADTMVAPYIALLRRIGPDGVTLTPAGYLPPAVVADMARELELDERWMPSRKSENNVGPVLVLRETARLLGLVRKDSGRLLLTPAGRRLKNDSRELWHHIAQRLPLEKDGEARAIQVVELLMMVATAPTGWTVDDAVDHITASLHWPPGHWPTSALDARGRGVFTRDVVRIMGALVDRYLSLPRDWATPEGKLLARAVLRSL